MHCYIPVVLQHLGTTAFRHLWSAFIFKLLYKMLANLFIEFLKYLLSI